MITKSCVVVYLRRPLDQIEAEDIQTNLRKTSHESNIGEKSQNLHINEQISSALKNKMEFYIYQLKIMKITSK